MSAPDLQVPTPTDAGGSRAEAVPLDLAAARARLAGARGPQYWQSLEELAATPEFEEMLHREFPRFASEWPSGVSRRNFLHLAAASLGLAGLTACTRQPLEKIVPYVRQPEEVIPGRPLHFATAMPLAGLATGLLVESHTGRPTKIEGNPEHPASLGATDAVTQAAILGLYDPDRTQTLQRLGRIATWGDLLRELAGAMLAQRALGGAGLRILTGAVTSPSLAAAIRALLDELPQAKWHQWEPLGREASGRGAELAFGAPATVRLDLAAADVVLAVESDFLTAGPWAVRHARDFAARRRVTPERPEMNRLYAVEGSPTATGAAADHRLALAPSAAGAFLLAVAAELGMAGAAAPSGLAPEAMRWAGAVARDLAAHRGRAAVVAGEALPPEAHVVALAINEAIGALGATVVVTEPVEAHGTGYLASLAELVADLEAGRVDTLLVLGTNPVYDAPAELGVAAALGRARLRVHHGLYADETAAHCQWQVPAAHFLESWGDARALDGTVSLLQPLVEPLYGGRTELELVAALGGRGDLGAYDLVREHWLPRLGDEGLLRKALHDGVVPGTALAPKTVAVQPAAVAAAASALAAAPRAAGDGLEVALRPDPSVLDGRFANNGWLQELPKPITKLTWTNVVLLSPRTAESLGVRSEELLELAAHGRTVAGPVWILPGQADGVATLHLGYGRRAAGRVGDGLGFDAGQLATAASRWGATGVTARRAGGRQALATTQGHHNIDYTELEGAEAAKRRLVREGTLAEYRERPAFAQEPDHPHLDTNASFVPAWKYEGHAWGMTIDLNACTGCNACVVACQSENNIPVVGEEQVRIGREMHWMRIDRYFKGEIDEPEGIVHQPVTCMHCEQAPCEVVCPVAATVHSDEGLNDMVYNRCVGTRYCSNNCPYKVRRFNFLLYQDWETPSLALMRNPDVTVRSRGVMEKCTYCVQRINHARIAASREGRAIRDGEVVTACQQACPSRAIVFGDLNDAGSAVAAAKGDSRNYGLLTELGTRPRTTYLARLRNPNPELESA